jgi:hypothetical protein
MKKIYISTVVILGTLLFIGCSDKEIKPKSPEQVVGECVVSNLKAPKWVCGNITEKKGLIFDVGSAHSSAGGFAFTKKNALANARGNMAQQINVLVKDKVEQYMSSTGIGDSETIDTISTQVSKQVAKVSLNGSKQINLWQGKDEVFVLISMDNARIGQEVVKNIKTSLNNDNAMWQKFQAQQSLKSLEDEFNKN